MSTTIYVAEALPTNTHNVFFEKICLSWFEMSKGSVKIFHIC